MTNNSEKNEEEPLSVRRLEPGQISEREEIVNFKIIIVGNSGVGKSCLLKRAVQRNFTDSYQATIGFEFLLMYYEVNGIKLKLQIWDTCGQEMYRSLIQGFYRNTSLTILIYAVNDQRSFDDLNDWIKDIKNNCEKAMPIFLIGNKCDLEEEIKVVKPKDAENLVEQLALQYFTEASAKSGTNVDKTFVEIVKYLYKECYLKGKSITKKFKMGLEKKEFDDTNVKKKKCC